MFLIPFMFEMQKKIKKFEQGKLFKNISFLFREDVFTDNSHGPFSSFLFYLLSFSFSISELTLKHPKFRKSSWL